MKKASPLGPALVPGTTPPLAVVPGVLADYVGRGNEVFAISRAR